MHFTAVLAFLCLGATAVTISAGTSTPVGTTKSTPVSVPTSSTFSTRTTSSSPIISSPTTSISSSTPSPPPTTSSSSYYPSSVLSSPTSSSSVCPSPTGTLVSPYPMPTLAPTATAIPIPEWGYVVVVDGSGNVTSVYDGSGNPVDLSGDYDSTDLQARDSLSRRGGAGDCKTQLIKKFIKFFLCLGPNLAANCWSEIYNCFKQHDVPGCLIGLGVCGGISIANCVSKLK